MKSTPIKEVSDTAFIVASYRALEDERTEPLFRDPLARRLVGKRGQEILENLPHGYLMRSWVGWTIALRTYIIDEFIRSAITNGIDTVVNLGAGLDTRPYRLDLPPSLNWIEVDYPHVIQLKEKRLSRESPRCHLQRTRLDLTDSEARQNFLASVAARSKKALALTEGVIPYLSESQVAALAEELKARPVFRYWIADYFSPRMARYARRKSIRRIMRNAPLRFAPKDYFAFFDEHGWRVKEIRYIEEEAQRLNRPLPWPQALKTGIRLWEKLLPPGSRSAPRKFSGYVLFEPKSAAKNTS